MGGRDAAGLGGGSRAEGGSASGPRVGGCRCRQSVRDRTPGSARSAAERRPRRRVRLELCQRGRRCSFEDGQRDDGRRPEPGATAQEDTGRAGCVRALTSSVRPRPRLHHDGRGHRAGREVARLASSRPRAILGDHRGPPSSSSSRSAAWSSGSTSSSSGGSSHPISGTCHMLRRRRPTNKRFARKGCTGSPGGMHAESGNARSLHEPDRPNQTCRSEAIFFVGDTGIEPVTSSVSGKRATAAPIALG